ncbi:hypothetical protein F5884DRAFT_896192 [Xylogone sp. PMI_703]|nr:hypothetical protein F5884DRAFT_896192 [Xylogone sp. PMI_703]
MSSQDTDEESDDYTRDPDETRPNRFEGQPSTWLTWTEQERGLAASLDQLRSCDLSVHLFNAHALKVQGRAGKISEKHLDNARIEESLSHQFVPPQFWTAWPLKPDEVPREDEKIDLGEDDDEYTLRKTETFRPNQNLEEVLVGLTLKFAKERFLSRQFDNPEILPHESNDPPQQKDHADKAPPRDKNQKLKVDWHSQGELQVEDYPINDELDVHQDVWLTPVVATDDDRSTELLQPSIKHTLGQLDEVLMALHHARKLCYQYGSVSDTNTDDENHKSSLHDESPIEKPAKRMKRGVGRPRKDTNIASQATTQRDSDGGGEDDPNQWRRKRSRIGRPRKHYERIEGETEHEYLVRVARLQKKPLPKFPPSQTTHTPEARTSPTRGNRKLSQGLSSELLKPTTPKRLGLRDWSEVIGSASLKGFSDQVIARATQRCADMFGEGMKLRSLVESSMSMKAADELLIYRPGQAPEHNVEVHSTEELSGTDSSNSEAGSSISKSSRTISKLKGVPLRRYYCFCPISDCERYVEGFNSHRELQKHLEGVHDMPKDKIDNLLLDSEDEMDGAVHMDGFMRPAKALRGWRGRGQNPKKSAVSSKKEASIENDVESHI